MKAWIVLVIVSSALCLAACGSEAAVDQQPSEASEVDLEQTPLSFGEDAAFESTYSINDGPELETELNVTPLSIQTAKDPDRWTVDLADELQGKIDNAVWLKLKVQLKSTGRDEAQQSDLEYTLVDDEGERSVALDSVNVYKPAISCCGSGYDGNEMAPGDKATGFIAFRAAKSFRPTKLRVGEAGGGDSQEWKVPNFD